MNTNYITEIKSEEEFTQLLQLPKAILYINAEWSIHARFSWSVVSATLRNNQEFTIPAFKLDASEQLPYFENWLTEQKNIKPDFIYGGWGETVLIEQGNITDFISRPSKLGSEKTTEMFKSWQ